MFQNDSSFIFNSQEFISLTWFYEQTLLWLNKKNPLLYIQLFFFFAGGGGEVARVGIEYLKREAYFLPFYLLPINGILTCLLIMYKQDDIYFIYNMLNFLIIILECFYNLPNFLRFYLDTTAQAKFYCYSGICSQCKLLYLRCQQLNKFVCLQFMTFECSCNKSF